MWELFLEHETSAESERAYIHARRVRDEFWYAARFGLDWPKLVPSPKAKPSVFDLDQPLMFVDPTPGPCDDCRILRNLIDISPANKNDKALPGEQIQLSLHCHGTPSSPIHWSISGPTFRDYKETSEKGYVTHLTSKETDNQTAIWFRWLAAGYDASYNVTVTFKLDGKDCSASATITVKMPLVSIESGFDPPPIGTAVYDASAGKVKLDPSILFHAAVDIPSDFDYGGRWKYLQLGTLDHFLEDQLHSCERRLSPNHKPQLDGINPYGGTEFLTGPGYIPTEDHPSQDMFPIFVQASAEDTFTMYVMFKSIRHDGAYVPVKKVNWRLSWCCANDGSGWKVINKSAFAGPWQRAVSHPTWKSNVDDLHFVPVSTCPPPCTPT